MKNISSTDRLSSHLGVVSRLILLCYDVARSSLMSVIVSLPVAHGAESHYKFEIAGATSRYSPQLFANFFHKVFCIYSLFFLFPDGSLRGWVVGIAVYNILRPFAMCVFLCRPTFERT